MRAVWDESGFSGENACDELTGERLVVEEIR
jgi:hypothetical protein